jgi:hypothetical protein
MHKLHFRTACRVHFLHDRRDMADADDHVVVVPALTGATAR